MYPAMGFDFDTERWQRALRSSHTMTARMELWSEDQLVTESAPFLSGMATEEWVSGFRWHLQCTIPPTRQWLRWLGLPSLELRPFRGVRFTPDRTWEMPLGRYTLLPPEISLPKSANAISVTVNDQWQRVVNAKFRGPASFSPGSATAAMGVLIQQAGLPYPEITASSGMTAAALPTDKQRDETLLAAAKATGSEVFLDRSGQPQIRDLATMGNPTSTLLAGVDVSQVKVTPDWSKVYNVVIVRCTATGTVLPQQEATISWTDHPAHPYRLGSSSRPDYRVYLFSSPLFTSTDQMLLAARSILARVSSAATTCSYVAIPDASREAGDTAVGALVNGSALVQLQSVGHPLTPDTFQPITTVSTQMGPEGD